MRAEIHSGQETLVRAPVHNNTETDKENNHAYKAGLEWDSSHFISQHMLIKTGDVLVLGWYRFNVLVSVIGQSKLMP